MEIRLNQRAIKGHSTDSHSSTLSLSPKVSALVHSKKDRGCLVLSKLLLYLIYGIRIRKKAIVEFQWEKDSSSLLREPELYFLQFYNGLIFFFNNLKALYKSFKLTEKAWKNSRTRKFELWRIVNSMKDRNRIKIADPEKIIKYIYRWALFLE